jgi:LPS-assembly lipoprotein
MLFCKNLSVFLVILILPGCGFQPIFGSGTSSIIKGELQYIEISPIANKTGQTLRNQLVQNIQPLGKSKTTKYRLNVRLTENKQRLAIKKSEIATRANLSFIANYEIFSKASGTLLTQGTSHMISSYNILTHTYATLIAEKDARNRAIREIGGDITSKVASFFRLNKDKIKSFK